MTTRPVEGALVEKVDQLGKPEQNFTTGKARKFTGTLRLDSFRRQTEVAHMPPSSKDGGAR